MKLKSKGFTLVELIVVITILAILGTISFISFNGYVQNSRDSNRVSDISSLVKVIELFIMESSKYPEPTNPKIVTYSGAEVWSQGTFGASMLTNVKKLNKVPVDPFSENEYTYSVNKFRSEFQVGGITENSFSYNPLGSTANANLSSGKIVNAFIDGQFNGKISLVSTGGIDYILATPSIISNNLSSTNILDLASNNNFVYNKQFNLPLSYSGTSYDLGSGIDFNPSNIVIFSGSVLIDLKSGMKVVELSDNLNIAYSGSSIRIYDDSVENSANRLITVQETWLILGKIISGLPKLNEYSSCKEIKDFGDNQGNGFYAIFNSDKTGIYNTYCHMDDTLGIGGGRTYLFSVDPAGTKWDFESIQWTTPVIDSALSDILTNEQTSIAYTSFDTNEIKICRGSLSNCYVINHSGNRTLQSFYTTGQKYVEFSRCLPGSYCNAGQAPDDIGLDRSTEFFSNLGISYTLSSSFVKYGIGINIHNKNKLGFQADNNNVWPGFDNIGMGIGNFRNWNCGWDGTFVDNTRARSISRPDRCVYSNPDDQFWYVFGK